MATQSAPPDPAELKTQNPEVVQQEAANENSTSMFVNSEPMREEQVQNAVKFLSHPKVRGSPVIYRRSFLEKKGLTKEEIDEAFRRVPDPPPTVSNGQNANTTPDGQLNPSSNIQPQAPTQTVQPAAAAVVSKVGMLTNFGFSHAVLAVGFLAFSGAGTAVLFKNAVIPRLKSWIRKVVLEEDDIVKKSNSKPSLGEEAAAAAKAAAAAAADAARASQDMLISKNEEKRCFEELVKLLDVQVQEMKSMSNTIKKLEGQGSVTGRRPLVEQEDYRVSVANSWQQNINGKPEHDEVRSARSSSPPASVEPSAAPHSKSYMEIIDMVRRGEKPPNIREINDLPPNPNQPLSNPRIEPRPKPWEVAQHQNSSSNVLQSEESNGSLNFKTEDNRFINQTNGDSSVPWWQRKNVRITELGTEDETAKTMYSTMPTMERPVQRSWVPPQPPPVAMPEAAAAIRHPKKSPFSNEQLTDDQLLARSSDVTDELQRITKISESGGVAEANGGSSMTMNTSEIQDEYRVQE